VIAVGSKGSIVIIRLYEEETMVVVGVAITDSWPKSLSTVRGLNEFNVIIPS
jgi:hypothetical protein